MTIPARTLARLLIGLSCLSALSGCGLFVVGGAAATSAAVATDRRTAGEQVDDQTIELRVSSEMDKAFGDKARISGTSYAGRLLLVGDVPTEADRQRAETIARGITKVRSVDNYIRVGDITPLSVRTNDTWLTSKVKSQLVATENVPFRTIKVTTERGVVYLMGKVTDEEGRRAAAATSGISGVNKVVKLFTIVARETLLTEPGKQGAAPVTDSSSSGAAAPPPAGDDGGVQTMPVQ
ncbi:BON domain-containing protein OS=Castellaniella defragrans (strain DSM / CCUG 39792 / 65Phen)OX=1437824 GN=BN940_03351 PE=4 SV=1 [Castellaniella denitrificans]|uniref:BON domain-containing protein n=1 Tax=Castellaniella sp. TaxID=1955812 RepID=UPI002AFEFD09|nr:BON domain-containing protein [Castellaniella sp.]